MLLTARQVVTPEGVLGPGWVRTEATTITGVGSGTPDEPPDVAAAWLIPGFTDLHMHGGGGHDATQSAEALRGAVAFHRRHGTTSTLVSLVTAPVEDLCGQLDRVADLAEADPGVLGAHLEGPFLSTVRCGAQNPAYLRAPDPDTVARLLDAARGHLRVVTLAPELPGATAAIEQLTAAGVVVAVGHTDAVFPVAREAFAAGATLATHLFNGMRPLHHRDPGPIGAALDAGVWCEVINDGVHTDPAVPRLVATALPPGRLVLITDAIAAAGAPDGHYRLGGQAVRVRNGQARLDVGGALAGSTLTLDDAVRRAITDVGLSPATAFSAATANPAAVLGLTGRVGQLAVGARADIVGLDEDFRVRAVVAAGAVVETVEGSVEGGQAT